MDENGNSPFLTVLIMMSALKLFEFVAQLRREFAQATTTGLSSMYVHCYGSMK